MAVDFQTAELMLHDAEETLNKVEDCSRLPPALDMLASLAKQHPAAWQARFGDIVDLLVGWFVDKNTATTVKSQIADVMGSFTVQWLDAAEFGQDLLDIFITDIETIVRGEAPCDEDEDKKNAAPMETAVSLISCFSIILKALVTHASQAVTRMAHLQERALEMLAIVRKATSSSDTQVNEIILALSLGNPGSFYNLQPKAIQILMDQFDNLRLDSTAWEEKMNFVRKILAVWRPNVHPGVVLEMCHPKTGLMQLRWLLQNKSIRIKDVLEAILVSLPDPTQGDQSPASESDHKDIHLQAWSSLIHEIRGIAYELNQESSLAEATDIGTILKGDLIQHHDRYDESRLLDVRYKEGRYQGCRRTGSPEAALLTNFTFDILLVTQMSRLWPDEASSIFLRLLEILSAVPEIRLALVVHALREISSSRKHFISDWIECDAGDTTGEANWDSSTLCVSLKMLGSLTKNWRLLSTSMKNCLVSWNADILRVVQVYHEKALPFQWHLLKLGLSCNLHQLVTNAGADEDELIRASISSVFENFIGAFGSLNLGPQLLAKIADRSQDVSPNVQEAWQRVLFQSNPFAFAYECYNVQETDITRALKILVLKSPNSGVFRYPHFSAVLSSLSSNDIKSIQTLNGSTPDIETQPDPDMLQRLFHSCQGKDILAKVNLDGGADPIATDQINTFPHSGHLLMYWSLWEAARYCVLSRLRTPYGSPQQTLDALEKQLNSLLQSEDKETTGLQRLTRLRNFLTLLDRLELQFQNAYHGTALGVIPLTPKPSIVFVRSNKSLWEDWFARVRSRIVEGAKVTGEYETVVRNGYILLADHFSTLCRGAVNDILPWLDDFESVLVDLVEALMATNGSDAISGLYVWCRRAIKDMTRQSSSSRSKHSRSERSTQYPRYKNSCLKEGQALALSQISLDWINTAVLQSQSRYEPSTKEAIAIVRGYSDVESAEDVGPPAEFLCQEITNSLSDLYSYQQLQTFMDSIPMDAYADRTLPWSDTSMMQALNDFCAEDASHAWKHLEDYYDQENLEQLAPDVFTADRTGLAGRIYLFASKAYLQSDVQAEDLDRIRQMSLRIVQPPAEFLLGNGVEHANGTLLDTLMLNTPAAATLKALQEFTEHVAQVPEEMRMHLFHKDLRFWARLDTLVNLAKRHASCKNPVVVKQSNEFKFLLSKVARRSECHEFASSIPRTWEGPLSPEIQLEEAKAAVAKHDYTTALSTSGRILSKVKNSLGTLKSDDQELAVLQSKIYLKMAKWSRSTKPQLSESNVETFEDILDLEHGTQQTPQARIETITATCLQKSIEIGPNYRKSWFALGTHHYKQGWGILDELGSFRFHHPIAISSNEMLKSILGRAGVSNLEEQSKPFDESTAYDSIRTHVMKIEQVAGSEEVVNEIIGSFQTLLQRILESYRLAIHGYFRFLQFAALEFECSQPKAKTTSGEEVENEVSQSAVSDEITATLRLLRLLAKHGGQLYDVFHENLVDINVSPWTNIIPQLFARLDHPEKPVQSLIADLLCKIGLQFPQLIVFHCVVGANSAHNSACQRRLLRFIGEFLTKSHPELVSQVEHLIRELERITVLWEEMWYKKIMSSISELKNTLQELTEQYHGLDAISGLGLEDKHAVMLDNYQQSVLPLLVPLENLQEAHSVPESNHEQWFVSTFRGRIQSTLLALRSPKSWDNLFEGLTLLKEICMDIGKEISGTRILKLYDLSPELSAIQSSQIAIPSPDQGTGVTIQSFDQLVVVIPTKTKPKKLTLLGSDGKRYTYLFKGLEDLHLDERVMQLLRISNGMLQRDKESSSRHLSARHYAVVPLSDNSGMIQWVESTVSIFTIIAKWQHREQMCARWMNDDSSTAPLQAPPRATELYNEKAMLALKKAGLPSNHPRRNWPKSILLDLYHEMASETPADLLEREIWASSPTAAEWWKKSIRFARSTAVMSMIGYVIGLGDRHLDNILIDFTTGDLVHIDYNVCFEKGKRLRIPEIVPFRLSRNMLTSLGVTGVEGNFRIGCEQTMKVMRKNKEILVTLLEAFVYDPLVDWQIDATTGQGGGAQGALGAGAGNVVGGGGLDVNGGGGDQDSEGQLSSRSLGVVRRLSEESLCSVSSMSIKSTATTDSSSKRWTASSWDTTDSNLLNGQGQKPHQMQQQDPYQQQQQQQQQPPLHQRNAYAVNILRRVRHKLEGRDFEAVKKCKVTEQVDRVIQEATNVENLANMYEGWTPWL
ncbi:Serine/threonine-protein kinase smg1 [Linnemannia gamsii]|uniref:non-specific serine/threonine protein kinase n=1 Tax=Linnemannia gamsii TaxID=64522 RepID=A0ABQ7KFH0_9FUNG|nr:Serine/threonine-protein kinase smg1 [Linnemannia gamsii]